MTLTAYKEKLKMPRNQHHFAKSKGSLEVSILSSGIGTRGKSILYMSLFQPAHTLVLLCGQNG